MLHVFRIKVKSTSKNMAWSFLYNIEEKIFMTNLNVVSVVSLHLQISLSLSVYIDK